MLMVLKTLWEKQVERLGAKLRGHPDDEELRRAYFSAMEHRLEEIDARPPWHGKPFWRRPYRPWSTMADRHLILVIFLMIGGILLAIYGMFSWFFFGS
jgi:hypothetical protein